MLTDAKGSNTFLEAILEAKEEIVDKTDVYIDVYKRVRVVAAAATSFVIGAPSAQS